MCINMYLCVFKYINMYLCVFKYINMYLCVFKYINMYLCVFVSLLIFASGFYFIKYRTDIFKKNISFTFVYNFLKFVFH